MHTPLLFSCNFNLIILFSNLKHFKRIALIKKNLAMMRYLLLGTVTYTNIMSVIYIYNTAYNENIGTFKTIIAMIAGREIFIYIKKRWQSKGTNKNVNWNCCFRVSPWDLYPLHHNWQLIYEFES